LGEQGFELNQLLIGGVIASKTGPIRVCAISARRITKIAR
jgi:hypothetical protein